MLVLAVDTCLEPGSLALLREGGPSLAEASEGGELETVPLPPGWRSTALHEEILRLLARHGWSTKDIAGYGVTTGPGSFTGVRLGLTAVKGLAEVHGKPIFPVSTLEVLAAAAVANPGRDRERAVTNPSRDREGAVADDSDKWTATSDEPKLPAAGSLVTGHSSLVTAFAPVLDARRGQIFGAVYQVEGDEFRPLLEATVCALRTFLARIQAAGLQEVRFCGTDLAPFLPEIEQAGWAAGSAIPVSPHLAGVLAQIALRRLQKGLGVSVLAADANYVRASDAELFWKE